MQYPFPWQIRQQRRTEGVWRRQSRDAMTNSGRDREREEGAGDSNEGGFLSLQIQGKWTDKEPNTAVSAFFPHRRCPCRRGRLLLLSPVHVISL